MDGKSVAYIKDLIIDWWVGNLKTVQPVPCRDRVHADTNNFTPNFGAKFRLTRPFFRAADGRGLHIPNNYLECALSVV